MTRAIFFDFYSVWTPDKFSYYLAHAQLNGPEVYKSLYDSVERYYRGEIDVNQITQEFRDKLGHPDITPNIFILNESNISTEIIDFIRSLHGHFIKIGILANLGSQEYLLLNNFNQKNQLFEIIASPQSMGIAAPLLTQAVFAKALQGIGEPPSSCLVVSGNPYFLAFAAVFGMATLQFQGLAKLQEDIGTILANETP